MGLWLWLWLASQKDFLITSKKISKSMFGVKTDVAIKVYALGQRAAAEGAGPLRQRHDTESVHGHLGSAAAEGARPLGQRPDRKCINITTPP